MRIHGQDYEIEVRVSLSFKGYHALPMRPELHAHTWDVEFSVSGPLDPKTGMVCDMLELSEFFRPFVKALDQLNLHEFEGFRAHDGLVGLAAKYPTCDTLAHYFLWKIEPEFRQREGFRDLRISQVKVGISEPDQREPWGHAIIRPKPR